MFDFLRKRAREANKGQFQSDFYSSNHTEGYNPTPCLWQKHHYFRGKKCTVQITTNNVSFVVETGSVRSVKRGQKCL